MARPRLFVIGDSISMHYGPDLQRLIAGRFDYARKTGEEPALAGAAVSPEHAALAEVLRSPNGGDSRAVQAYVRAMADDPAWRPDVVLLNAGLHDIKRSVDTQALQVEPDEYRRNLQGILATLAPRGATVLWVRTTPLEQDRHNTRTGPGMGMHRYEADHRQYDAIALEVMRESAVAVIDLHGFTLSLEGEVFCDHVHFTEPVRALQAAYIAGFLAGSPAGGNVVA